MLVAQSGRPPLSGVDEISLPQNATLIFEMLNHPKIPKLYIRSGATAIQWAYTLNTSSTSTVGGEVVQVLSATAGPINITGQTAGLSTSASETLDADRVRGWADAGGRTAYSPNHELKAIVDWFLLYMELAGSDARGNRHRNEGAIQFSYPERGWSFMIQVTALNGFRYDRTVIAPEWSIVAELVTNNALDYFSGITMTSFTDDLIANTQLLGKIGISAFVASGTQSNNGAFGNTGDTFSNDPFLNPMISATENPNIASKLGDNFQNLLGAYSSGNVSTLFSNLLDNGASPEAIDQIYSSIFGADFVTGSTTTTGGNTSTSTGSQTLQTGYKAQTTLASGANAPWITAVLTAVGAPQTVQNKNFLYSWWQSEGGGGPTQGGSPAQNPPANYNWLNTTMGSGYPSINSVGVKSYPSLDIGVKEIVASFSPSMVSALKSGNPYKDTVDAVSGLEAWNPSGGLAYAQKILSRFATATGTVTDASGKNSNATSATAHGFFYYSQFDPRWTNVEYGHAGTIGAGGCGITSMSMVLSTLLGLSITPDKAAQQFAEYGSPDGSLWSLFPAAAKAYKLKMTDLGSDLSQIPSVLSGGGLVIASGTNANKNPFTPDGHIVVVRAMSGQGVVLGDPNTSSPFTLKNAKNTTVFGLSATAVPSLSAGLQHLWAFLPS